MAGYVLPGAHRPHADESLPGLLMRNAERYRFRDPRMLLHRISPPDLVLWSLCREDPASKFGSDLRQLLNLSEDEFSRLSMWTPEETSVGILGQSVWRELVLAERRMVCPLCLQDSQHHRAAWMITAMPICGVHGVWLQDHCHRCHEPLSWQGHHAHRCSVQHCSADMRDAPVVQAAPDHLAAMIGLHSVLHATDPSAVSPLGLPFGQLLRLSVQIGRLRSGFKREARMPAFMKREQARFPEILDMGWSAFQDWPHGFNRLLADLQAKAGSRKGRDGLRKAFDILPNWVHEWVREPWGVPIGVAFTEYVASRSDIATTRNTVQRYSPSTPVVMAHVTTSEVQRATGVSPGAVRRVIERRGAYALAPQGEGTPSLISVANFEVLKKAAKEFALPEKARRLLGVGRRVFDQMEEAGLITQVPLEERFLEVEPYRTAELEHLVRRCVGRAPAMTREAAADAKFSTIISSTAPGRTVPDICKALLDGRLKSAGRVETAKGLMQVRLRLADVERVLPSSKKTMSVVDAAESIGVDYQHLTPWIRAGLLRSVRSADVDEHGVRVTPDDLKIFQGLYVTGAELARKLGQPKNHHVSRHLKFLGVDPVSGPGVDKGKLLLFRRADVGRKELGAVLRLQAGSDDTPQDKHRAAFARARGVAQDIERYWGAKFRREHNTFTDKVSGRVLQVVSGRRPDLTGVFVFHVTNPTMDRLRQAEDAWVALVAGDSPECLLVPLHEVPWKGESLEASYTRLSFDGRGRARELREWAFEISPDAKRTAASIFPAFVPEIEKHVYSPLAAEIVSNLWGADLSRARNTCVEVGGRRILQVIRGKAVRKSTTYVFVVTPEAMAKLMDRSGHAWLALVPPVGVEFMLVPFEEVPWQGGNIGSSRITVRFDEDGQLLDRRLAVGIAAPDVAKRDF